MFLQKVDYIANLNAEVAELQKKIRIDTDDLIMKTKRVQLWLSRVVWNALEKGFWTNQYGSFCFHDPKNAHILFIVEIENKICFTHFDYPKNKDKTVLGIAENDSIENMLPIFERTIALYEEHKSKITTIQ